MTISPPSKVNLALSEPFQILGSGFDTLYLAIDIEWKTHSFFEYLSQMKTLAIQEQRETGIILPIDSIDEEWPCQLMPYGRKGYEWLLEGNDYSLDIGNWREPQSRPSVMARISSEVLWYLGAQYAVDRLIDILLSQRALIKIVKVSRVDLCLDISFPEDLWSRDLLDYCVTRSRKAATHSDSRKIEGLSIGKGDISARLYDKPLEIAQKSHKDWMYDIWGIDHIHPEIRIIRIEFQLRREIIKQLLINTSTDLFQFPENLWAFCTKNWLKFQDRPGKHHTQRHTFDWWEIIQNGFLGVQNANPLVRCKAINVKKKQIFHQAYGLMVSYAALELEEKNCDLKQDTSINDVFAFFHNAIREYGKNDFTVSMDIFDKRAKYHKSKERLMEADKQRIDLGFPSSMTLENIIEEQEKRLGLESPFNEAQEDKFNKLERLANHGRVPNDRRTQ